MTVKENARQRDMFVKSLLAQALLKGVDAATLKTDAFGSYATGNRRLKNDPGRLTLQDLFNIATRIRVPPAELITTAAQFMNTK